MELDRKYQDIFVIALIGAGFDAYGDIEDKRLEKYVDDNKFKEYCGLVRIADYDIMPFYWGDNEDICNYPNFIDYKNNIVISWYKYPLRGAEINRKISERDFVHMLWDFVYNIRKELGDFA